jgi:hypothetical protein
MHAASTVIGKPFKSVYPVANGPADMNIKILNTTFKPVGQDPDMTSLLCGPVVTP